MTLSIVIPTRDRSQLLMRGARELAEQCRGLDAEILIVDDGSTDDTARTVERWVSESSVPAQLIRQAAQGPATARNRGIEAAAGQIVLFLGDDVVPAHGLVETHLRHHETFPESEVALLGKVTWSPELPITPLMHWLEHGGPQFCYYKIVDPMAVPPTFFWTANVSVKRAFVREAGGFSERFPGAAFEDVELGVRLARRGLRLHFEPQALGYHYHPVTLRGSLARMESVAKGALIASATVPGLVTLGDDGGVRRLRRAVAHSRIVRDMVVAAAPVCTAIPALRVPYYRFVHNLYYRAAVRKLAKCV
jgi:glycosyltransferase involved in cell wall biosynthesis